MFARARWRVGVPVVVAMAGVTLPGQSQAQDCRNYLTADQVKPTFDAPLTVPAESTPYYKRPDGTPVRVLHAREYTWQPAAGVCITKWGFEGTTPAPTIRATPHQPSELFVYNHLPERLYNPFFDPSNPVAWLSPPNPTQPKYTLFGPTPTPPPPPFDAEPFSSSQYALDPELTVHLHGGHQTPPYDGYPETTFSPGRSFVYDYPNRQPATTLWYHDHAMDHTRGHVLMGLAGFYLLDDPARDKKLGLPTGAFDIPIMFQRVPGEMLYQPEAVSHPVWTVNNALAPYLEVTNRPYRFRLLNGNDESPLQVWTTTTQDPHSVAPQAHLQQVGTDGGLMNHVAVAGDPSKTRVRLFPAERGEVVIDFSQVTTPTTFYLQAKTLAAFIGDNVSKTPQPVVEFRVNPIVSDPPRFAPPGGKLRPAAPIKRLNRHGARQREFVFDWAGENNVGKPPFATVNGRFFDMQRSYANPKLGATEVWRLVNNTDGYHPIHIHDIFFQVVSRLDEHGKPTERQPGDWGSGNLAWKDVFVVPPHGSVTIVGKFTDNKGLYVFHCHNLVHEDAGMMAQFDVGGSGPTVSAPAGHGHGMGG